MKHALFPRFLPGALAAFTLVCTLYAAPAVAAESINVSMSSGMDSLNIAWKAPVSVDCFKVFRRDITGLIDDGKEPFEFKGYACVARLSRSAAAYRDADVEFGHTYAYVVKGYKKRSGKLKLACTSYMKDAVEYASAGLVAPELLNGGTGEFFQNTGKAVYLYVQNTTGVELQGADLYRRAKGEKNYTQVRVRYPEGAQFSGAGTLLDSTVTPGTTYYYKARSWANYKGKKYYSGFSKRLRVAAVNTVGKFKVKTLTRAAKVSKIRVKVTSKAGNAKLKFLPSTKSSYLRGSGSKQRSCSVKLTKFSINGRKWRDIGKKGVVLEAGKAVWLEYTPTGASPVKFAGTAKGSQLNVRARYMNGVTGFTSTTLNLARHAGRSFVDWD